LNGTLLPTWLFREASAIARSQATASVLLVIVGLLGVSGGLVTSGQSEAFQQSVFAQIDSAAARSFELTVVDGAPLFPVSLVSRVESINAVELAFGLGPATDAHRAGLRDDSSKIAVFPFHGPMGQIVDVVDGRYPRSGEIILPNGMLTTVGFEHPIGTLSLDSPTLRLRDASALDAALVGGFSSRLSHGFLDRIALRAPQSNEEGIRRLWVTVDRFDGVNRVQNSIVAMSGVDPSTIRIESTRELEAIAEVLRGEVGGFARSVALAAVGISAVMAALIAFAAVQSRRVDFGRRRALGATRSTLVGLVVLQVAVPSTLGAVLGALSGVALVNWSSGLTPSPAYVLSLVVISCLAATIASLPPALLAAFRDPIRALRLP
jgi:putative ABC transport system permease protein